MPYPDYNKSIVNLSASISSHFGAKPKHSRLDLPLQKKVVLLIVDGLGYDHVMEHSSFLRENVAGKLTSVLPSTTASAMTAFMTGLTPLEHGCTGWFVKLRELGMVVCPLRESAREGTPLFLDYDKLFKLEGIFDKVKCPSALIQPEKIIDTRFTEALAGKAKRLGSTGLKDHLLKTEKAASLRGRRLVFSYWDRFDEYCHRFGTKAVRTKRHFRSVEKGIRSLARRLKDTTLIVCSDHGQVDVKGVVRLEDHPKLSECLSAPLCGEPRFAYCYVRPDKVRQFRKETRKLKDKMMVFESGKLISYFGDGIEHPEFSHRIGDYVLVLKDNNVIFDRLLVEEEKELKGAHGGISSQEMFVPLVVMQT